MVLREDQEDFIPRYYTWDEFNAAVDELKGMIEGLEEHPEWGMHLTGGLYGVPRGGLPLAVALSHRLDLPVLKEPQEHMILVDDIYDSGRTINGLRSRFTDVVAVCWLMRVRIHRDSRIPSKLLHVSPVAPSIWAIFPWEDPNKAAADFDAYVRNRKNEG